MADPSWRCRRLFDYRCGPRASLLEALFQQPAPGPQANGAVRRAAGEYRLARRESDAADSGPVPAEKRAYGAGVRVPQANGAVHAAAGERAAVGVEGQGGDRALMYVFAFDIGAVGCGDHSGDQIVYLVD